MTNQPIRIIIALIFYTCSSVALSQVSSAQPEINAYFPGAHDDKTYREAFDAMRNGDHIKSAQLFQKYIDKFPTGKHAADAWYWLGESHYLSKNYSSALPAFETIITRFPASAKYRGAILKKGLCQIEIDQKIAGEQTLNYLVSEYPGTDEARFGEQVLASKTKNKASTDNPEKSSSAVKHNDPGTTAGMVIGAIIKGYLAHKYGSSALEPYGEKSEEGCKSDFSCGTGKYCVKAPLESTGTCLKRVDEYGLPTFEGPDVDSYQTPIGGQCDFDLDCPITFKCDKNLKVCVK